MTHFFCLGIGSNKRMLNWMKRNEEMRKSLKKMSWTYGVSFNIITSIHFCILDQIEALCGLMTMMIFLTERKCFRHEIYIHFLLMILPCWGFFFTESIIIVWRYMNLGRKENRDLYLCLTKEKKFSEFMLAKALISYEFFMKVFFYVWNV